MPEPIVSITLMGPPRGKGRPRTAVRGSFATIFTDSKTRKYEDALKQAGIAAMGDRRAVSEALSVVVRAFMPVPESWSKAKKAAALAGDFMPTTGIDLDNIIKMIDGLNHYPPAFKGDKLKIPIIWQNDSQIVSMQAIKVYSDRPRLVIDVWRWDG